MKPAALTRPGLPAHAPVPLDAANAALCPSFSSTRRRLMGRGLTILGIAISPPVAPPKAGFSAHNKGCLHAYRESSLIAAPSHTHAPGSSAASLGDPLHTSPIPYFIVYQKTFIVKYVFSEIFLKHAVRSTALGRNALYWAPHCGRHGRLPPHAKQRPAHAIPGGAGRCRDRAYSSAISATGAFSRTEAIPFSQLSLAL